MSQNNASRIRIALKNFSAFYKIIGIQPNMAEEAKVDQDGWTDNVNYDRVNTLLEDVEAMAEQARKHCFSIHR